MTGRTIIGDTPYLHFLRELEAVFAKEGVRLSDEAHVYLAGLLAAVSWQDIHRRTGSPDTLAEAFAAALQQDRGVLRDELLRRVGNSALLLCGLWWRQVNYKLVWRTGVDQDYHERIGRHAFARIDQELFQELAQNFIGVVDVFARIGDSIAADRPLMPLDAYVSMLKTNNRLVERVLREQGLLVIMPDTEN